MVRPSRSIYWNLRLSKISKFNPRVAEGNIGIARAALTAFGNALHTMEDWTSPAQGERPSLVKTWEEWGSHALAEKELAGCDRAVWVAPAILLWVDL